MLWEMGHTGVIQRGTRMPNMAAGREEAGAPTFHLYPRVVMWLEPPSPDAY